MIRFILGTRPEAIKIKPILVALKGLGVAFDVVGTGQHATLLDGTGIKLDHDLGLASQNDPEAYRLAIAGALDTLHVQAVHVVVVQGDTVSALAGAEYGVRHGIPVAHVEAGLRSHDLADPWPEESYRIEIDRLSSYHYCPTPGNAACLAEEGHGPSIHITGNTITDALRLSRVTREPGNHVLVTLHRRESFGEPLVHTIRGLAAAAHHHPATPFCWPIHPNPAIQDAIRQVSLPPNVLMRPALPYHHFLTFLASAKAVLTDSGGVIEEACTLGVPTVIARHHTERPEAIAAGNAQLVGTKSSAVWEGLDWAFHATTAPSTTFGDGHAASRIAQHLATL